MPNLSEVLQPDDDRAPDSIRLCMKPGEMDRIRRAAELSGVNLLAFVRASAALEAGRILRERQTTALSERDVKMLLEALEHLPPPTKAARDAVHKFRELIANAL